jgi:hypothetical protein
MRDALAEARHEPEHEMSGALRMHEAVRRWWQGARTAISRGMEGAQARSLLSLQLALCQVDAIFLQVALDNAADVPRSEDVDRARAALVEAREIEAQAREWLDLTSKSPPVPSAEQLAHGRAAYEGSETEDLKDVIARLKAKRSS